MSLRLGGEDDIAAKETQRYRGKEEKGNAPLPLFPNFLRPQHLVVRPELVEEGVEGLVIRWA